MTLKYEIDNLRRGIREHKPVKARGPFPDPQWAWPTGGRDLLLRAAILDDIPEAVTALREWMATHELEDIHFAEQRLVVAISHRMPAGALEGREKTRLGGVERQLWSQCIVAFREARPAFAAMAKAGIPVMVMRGAARSVLDISNLRGRFAREIDVVVPPADFERAVEAVLAAGWGWRGGHRKNLRRLTGMNLVHGKFGEVDVHRFMYHQVVLSDGAPDALWSRATQHEFLDQTVYVPSPTDRLLTALAHGSIDGHGNSDWLVDSALLIRSGEVDWPLFEKLALERDLAIGALIGLSYLAGPLKVPVPADTLRRLEADARRKPIRRALALLEARPKREHSFISALGRGLARIIRHARYDAVLARLNRQI